MLKKMTVLHLSDLHFGDQNETNSAKRTNTLNKLLFTLKNLLFEWKPQSIAISGDIGWHGLENDYNIAKAWLLELLKTLDLSANDIIPAPGNHDINLEIATMTAASLELYRKGKGTVTNAKVAFTCRFGGQRKSGQVERRVRCHLLNPLLTSIVSRKFFSFISQIIVNVFYLWLVHFF